MDDSLFKNNLVQSNRILYTASAFAKKNLIYLQEAGDLCALQQHTSKRELLHSYLFFVVIKGEGTLQYKTETYALSPGYCAFIDCRNRHSHKSSDTDLWELRWVHFYGPTMDGIYEKYMARGGKPCFYTEDAVTYRSILHEIFDIANLDSDVRDMMIFEKLTTLLRFTMVESHKSDSYRMEASSTESKLHQVKTYLDTHYTEKVSLDELEQQFFINKFYLTRIFKQQFGISISNYLIQQRITSAKFQLRFTNQTIEEIGRSCCMPDASYFNRVFKKIEGIGPGEFRRLWAKKEG